MSDRFEISEYEAEVVRLFLIDLPEEAQRREFLEDAEGDWPPIVTLNATSVSAPFTRMDRRYMEVVNPRDLDELGLSGLLIEGYGIAEEEVAPLRSHLDSIQERVLIVGSRAFAGQAVTVEPRAPLRWIATLRQESPRSTMEQLHVATAQGQASAGGTAEPVKPALPMVLKVTLVLMVLAAIIAIVLGFSGAGK